ncbi:MAG: hypothetical protein K6G23_01245, partial [Lachnospiraceae bacterium]|nr:hypothetical protein [Lachnospiraceae bacterium]
MSKEYSQGTGAPGMLRMRSLLYLVLLGCASSLLLNGLASLFQLPQLDAGYQRAQESLYAVPLWQGLLYYGLLFPIGEELVFRGIG